MGTVFVVSPAPVRLIVVVAVDLVGAVASVSSAPDSRIGRRAVVLVVTLIVVRAAIVAAVDVDGVRVAIAWAAPPVTVPYGDGDAGLISPATAVYGESYLSLNMLGGTH